MSGPTLGVLDMAAGAPGIVAVGYAARPDMKATTWFSPDGESWDRAVLGDPSQVRVSAVTWDGTQFVMVGEDRSRLVDWPDDVATETAQAAVWASPDGLTWTRAPQTDVLDVGGFIDTTEDPMTGGMADVIAGPAGLVAVGSACEHEPALCVPAAWTSPDGQAWTRVTDLPEVAGVLKGVAAFEDGYVAVGAQDCDANPLSGSEPCPALVLTSADGRAWTKQPFAQDGDLRAITLIGDRFLATAPDGPETLWTSPDGATWTAARFDSGPLTGNQRNIVVWRFAATPEVAVWLGPRIEPDGDPADTAAWVSEAGR